LARRNTQHETLLLESLPFISGNMRNNFPINP